MSTRHRDPHRIVLFLLALFAFDGVHARPAELYRCKTATNFNYWTSGDCAPGDYTHATVVTRPNKTMAESIRAAECKYQIVSSPAAVARSEQHRKRNPHGGWPGEDVSKCD